VRVCQLDLTSRLGDGPAVFLIFILGALAVLLAFCCLLAGAAGMDQLAILVVAVIGAALLLRRPRPSCAYETRNRSGEFGGTVSYR